MVFVTKRGLGELDINWLFIFNRQERIDLIRICLDKISVRRRPIQFTLKKSVPYANSIAHFYVLHVLKFRWRPTYYFLLTSF